MTSIVVQGSKYLMMFMFLIYVFECFHVFRSGKEEQGQKSSYRLQKVMLYGIHILGFLCLYIQEQNEKLILFYLIQTVLISGIFLFYHYMYKNPSILLINNMCMFLVIGFIMLTRLSTTYAMRQFIFVAAGGIAMIIIPLFLQKGSRFRKLAPVYFAVGVIALAIVTFKGATSYGAKLTISIAGFSFQPSEFVKIIFVFFIASMLYNNANVKRVLLTSGLAAVFVLLLVASKDLGGALLYFMAYLIMIYVASRETFYLKVGVAGISVAGVVGYFLFSHVRTRVSVWIDPLADIDNQGYQVCQSLFGIGTGSWFGLGLGEGLPNKIPVVEKDFIFSAISEEFGAIFAICLILLCLSCFIMIVNVSIQMKDRFYKLVAIGLATLYAMQVILTIGGAIKFIPSTGVTLPLVSYGGSSVLSTLIIFGIVQGLYMRKANAKNISKKKQNNAEFTVVTYIFTTIFIMMIAYFVYFLAIESEDFINNSYNSLQTLFEEDVVKGEIVTSDGYVIAETITDESGNETRTYPYGKLFSHVTGYTRNSSAGLERQLNFTLFRSHSFFLEQLIYQFTGEKAIGDNVITTIRYDLQKVAYDALGKYNGAVIALEPATGEILTMVSKPDYNPNTIAKDWDSLQSGSALYNRATQGQYTPGSVFKIFTTLAYIKEHPDYADYTYECKGEITIDGKTIHCASNKKHGIQTLEETFANSCNTSYANLIASISPKTFNELCNSLLFNQALPIAFESSKSSFSISKNDTTALKMDTAIGQGKTLVSPLHMAMIAGAVANDGIVMRPTLVDYIENYKGILVEETKAKEYKTVLTEEQTQILSEFMRTTVEDGTASSLASGKYTAYGKTGTAQTTSDLNKTNAWFVGYAEYEGKEIAIAVVVENSGNGSRYAVPIAKKVFDSYFSQ